MYRNLITYVEIFKKFTKLIRTNIYVNPGHRINTKISSIYILTMKIGKRY